ncbi:MAG: glycosyltransferase, partial [Acidimicrobiales bacterium]
MTVPPGRPSGTAASAVVVSFNSAAYLPECLRSLRSEGVVDVVVVDNASSDGSVQATRTAD